jgi:hypothetical protein
MQQHPAFIGGVEFARRNRITNGFFSDQRRTLAGRCLASRAHELG